MFNLNDYITSVSLETINLITLKYYSSKSEIMNIYDTSFDFDENIVPLVTSVLEIKPNIMNAKRYCNVNSESIITIGNENEIPNKSQISYPCFFSDIQQNKISSQNTQGYIHNLIVTVDTQLFPKAVPKVLEKQKQDLENPERKSRELEGLKPSIQDLENPARKHISVQNKSALIRMYKLENQKGEFNYNILNEEEIIIILWNLDFANFQIIINKKQPNKCQLQINIYITEDNTIIVSKLEQINNLVNKINKINII
jgi:hypothetical protein